ncbi:hypothetical protein B0H11DRAFT_2398915 [Mycena galericulata]|nr:hypothetical protein B0H11DRAFT_2398915 [Mycena galericulata]
MLPDEVNNGFVGPTKACDLPGNTCICVRPTATLSVHLRPHRDASCNAVPRLPKFVSTIAPLLRRIWTTLKEPHLHAICNAEPCTLSVSCIQIGTVLEQNSNNICCLNGLDPAHEEILSFFEPGPSQDVLGARLSSLPHLAGSLLTQSLRRLYLLVLPFQIVSGLHYLVIPGTAFASFLLLGCLEIGQEIENPFNYDENDLDLDGFCLAIQRELREVTAHTTPDPSTFVFTAWR